MTEAALPRVAAPDARDVAIAAALALVAALVYAATAQTRMHGDASWMLVSLSNGGPGSLLHPLLNPAHRAARALVGGDPGAAAYLVSHLAGGVGAGATYLLARGFRAGRAGAAAAAGLAAGTPALWFFATTIEVHALHFAVAACAGCAVLLAPWRRPALATLLTLGALPFVHASHQFSILMGFGWPALVRVAHERSGRPLPWTRAYAVWGPLALATLAATQVAITWFRAGELALDVGEETTILAQYHDSGKTLEMAWRGWIAGLGLLLPVGLIGGLRRSAPTRAERWTPLLFWLPPVLFLLLVYPVPERGGFALGSAPFLAVWAARALGPWRPLVVGPLVACQLALGYAALAGFDRGFDPAERVARVRQIVGEAGLLLAGDHLAPPMHHYLPDVIEIDVLVAMRRAGAVTEPRPELLEPFLREHVGRRPVAVDLSYGTLPDRRTFVLNDPTPADRRWMDAFVAWVEGECITRRHPDPWWPLLVVEGWSTPP